VDIIDLEVSLPTSLLRVLLRNPLGKDPCPSLEAIVGGFERIRKHRAHIIKKIRQESAVKKYELYCFTKLFHDRCENLLIAKKVGDRLAIFHDDLFAKSCELPTKKEIEDQVSQVITADLIESAIASEAVPASASPKLEIWQGMTLSEAIEMHSKGLTPLT